MTDPQPTITDQPLTPLPPTANKNIPKSDIIALKLAGLNTRQIAETLGCSKTNIHNRLKQYEPEIKGLKVYKDHRADIFALEQKRLLDSIDDKDIKKTPIAARMTSFGILYDKERLERGESTENIAHIHKVAKGIRDRMRGITSG